MQIPHFLRYAALSIILCLSAVLSAQDTSQRPFSEIQEESNSLVHQGRLVEALPLLEELIKRVEAVPTSEVKLDLPIFLAGTAEIQKYMENRDTVHLNNALKWYSRLEKNYPDSRKLKEALFKSVEIYQALKRDEDAKKLIIDLLSRRTLRLTSKDENKLMKKFVELTYYRNEMDGGLPIYQRFLTTAQTTEDKALAAAALFQVYISEGKLDEATKLLAYFAGESDAAYRPQLNVTLLQASDKFAAKGRFDEVGIILNMIKTTDAMIQYQERRIAWKKERMKQASERRNNSEQVDLLKSEIEAAQSLLASLRKLPSLRSDLLVRRARNYTTLQRPYEAFWMFYDLMVENPESEQSEFYHYASFANALRLNKDNAILSIAREYRSKFPQGANYDDVISTLAIKLDELGYDDEFLTVSEDFLEQRPTATTGGTVLAQWISHLIRRGDIQRIIEKSTRWEVRNKNSTYADGIYFWRGISYITLSNYTDSVEDFDKLIAEYPTSKYYEDANLRRGLALFYGQQIAPASEALYKFTSEFPDSKSLDQAYFFLGDIESYVENYDLALSHFKKALQLASSNQILALATFRIGGIYEQLERYDEMLAIFQNFLKTNPNSKKITDAIFQVGRAYEFTQNPFGMLTLYRNSIEKYSNNPDNLGVDALIEGYAENYTRNKILLQETVALLDKLENDSEFRTQFVTDRGFLFEQFYYNKNLDPSLYNRLRTHPAFTQELINDLSPINEVTDSYRKQLAKYPTETPEAFFRKMLKKATANNEPTSEIRMLMGLHRSGADAPSPKLFDEDDFRTASPRVLLYIADSARKEDINTAVKAWKSVLQRFPGNDACIVSYLRLADVNEQRGEFAEALQNLKAIENTFSGSPQLPAVILRQGEILSKTNDTEAARARYQFILKVKEWRGVAHARALLQTGHSYMIDKAYEKAHGFYERTFLTYPQFGEWSARAYLADAQTLVKIGATADAVATLQEAVERLEETAPEKLFLEIKSKLKDLQS